MSATTHSSPVAIATPNTISQPQNPYRGCCAAASLLTLTQPIHGLPCRSEMDRAKAHYKGTRLTVRNLHDSGRMWPPRSEIHSLAACGWRKAFSQGLVNVAELCSKLPAGWV